MKLIHITEARYVDYGNVVNKVFKFYDPKNHAWVRFTLDNKDGWLTSTKMYVLGEVGKKYGDRGDDFDTLEAAQQYKREVMQALQELIKDQSSPEWQEKRKGYMHTTHHAGGRVTKRNKFSREYDKTIKDMSELLSRVQIIKRENSVVG